MFFKRDRIIVFLVITSPQSSANKLEEKEEVMTLENIIVRLSTNPQDREAVSRLLTQPNRVKKPDCQSLRTFSITEAAREMGVCRMTAFRLVKTGKLETFETFNGRRRIPADSLISLIHSKAKQA